MDRGRVNAKIRDILFSEWLGTVESEPLEAMSKRRDKIAATLADLSALRIKIQADQELDHLIWRRSYRN
jgi:hypothetical protein